MDSNLLKTKSIAQLVGDVEHGEKHLKRALSAVDLTLLGIGAIIGTGIFVLTGTAAANQSGPAITMSYMLAGLACGFAALCYAEFASIIPIAGSAYTYAYATLGELLAWIIGWDLILEYLFAAATVSVYKKARQAMQDGKPMGFTGVDDPYEPPVKPEISLKGYGATPEENAHINVKYLEDQGFLLKTN